MPTGVSSKRSLRPERFSVPTSFPDGQVELWAGFSRALPLNYYERMLSDALIGDVIGPHASYAPPGLKYDGPACLGDWCCLRDFSSIWQDLGGFDRTFFLFFEDIDLCLRHRKRGGRCGVSRNLKVMHTRGVASRRHSEFAESHYRKSQEIFWERHGDWWSRRWMKLINRIQRRRSKLRYHWRRRR